MNKLKKVFISAINFNNSVVTVNFLNSIKSLERGNFELTVLIVDNSTKEKFETRQDYLNPVKLKILRPGKNLGFAGGQNYGIKFALEHSADFVLVVNNDTFLDKKLVKELIESANKSNAGIVVPKIYFKAGSEFHKERYKKNDLGKVLWYAGGEMDWKNLIGHHRGVDEIDHGQYDKEEETNSATGCCMFIKVELLTRIGLFNEDYFLYYEDADFSIRTKRASFKIIFQPKAVLWHENAEAAGGSGSSLQDYYISRNRLIFGFKYASLRTEIALIKESLVILLTGRYWQKIGVRDFYLKRLGKGSYSK